MSSISALTESFLAILSKIAKKDSFDEISSNEPRVNRTTRFTPLRRCFSATPWTNRRFTRRFCPGIGQISTNLADFRPDLVAPRRVSLGAWPAQARLAGSVVQFFGEFCKLLQMGDCAGAVSSVRQNWRTGQDPVPQGSNLDNDQIWPASGLVPVWQPVLLPNWRPWGVQHGHNQAGPGPAWPHGQADPDLAEIGQEWQGNLKFEFKLLTSPLSQFSCTIPDQPAVRRLARFGTPFCVRIDDREA